MTSGYDRDFDVEQANIWKNEVQNELVRVTTILREVNEFCSADPIDGDPILENMMEVNNLLQQKWSELEQGFNKVVSGLDDIIQKVSKTVMENLDKINTFKEKAKNL